MEKGGKAWVVVLIVVVALIVVGLLVYFLAGRGGSSNANTAPSTNIYASHCKITSSTTKMDLSAGISSSIPLSGYQGTLDEVSWKSADPNIAVVNPVSGPDAMVQAKSAGTTTITATDNAVGPACTVQIQITVN